VQRHVWGDYTELAEDYRHTPEYRDIYKLRSQTIERVFADAKEKHTLINLSIFLFWFSCYNIWK
jgi:hypothetical protein